MKIVVVGGKGSLGLSLSEELSAEYLSRSDLDICDYSACLSRLRGIDLVINCAASTSVDLSYKVGLGGVNIVGNYNLNEVCSLYDINLINISTDYVFSGGICSEDTRCNPMNLYGYTKLCGERLLLIPHINIRTSWLFSSYGGFVKRMLGLLGNDCVHMTNLVSRPTSAHLLSRSIVKMIDYGVDKLSGNWHIAGPVVYNYYDFTCEIFNICSSMGYSVPRVLPGPGGGVARPSVQLDCSKAISHGFGIDDVGLQEVIERILGNG